MDITMKAWLDGTLVDWMEARVSPLSHGFSRASAVFEVMAIVPAMRGPALFCIDDHVDRFFSSAERTFMSIPFSSEQIKEAILATARANAVKNGIVKCYAYFSDIDLGPIAPQEVSVAVFCLDYGMLGVSPAKYSYPLSVGISQYRKLHPATAAVHAKVVGNYVNGYLARTEVRRKGFDEALMLDTTGLVAEGPTSNIFLVRDRCVETPTKENVLPGITRKVVIDVLKDMGFAVKESRILPQDLCEYDEAFFSGTLRHVQPIRRIEDCVLTCPGPVTQDLMGRMMEVYSGTVEKFEGLLAYIG
jgi:branched-chain amino acid aminotransferase